MVVGSGVWGLGSGGNLKAGNLKPAGLNGKRESGKRRKARAQGGKGWGWNWRLESPPHEKTPGQKKVKIVLAIFRMVYILVIVDGGRGRELEGAPGPDPGGIGRRGCSLT